MATLDRTQTDATENVLHREQKKGLHINAYTVFTLCFVGLGSMTYGYSASIIGTTLGQPSFIHYMGLDTNPDATQLIATMNGLYQAGGVFACASLSFFADRWGRRSAIAVAAILSIIGGALLCGSVNVAMFLVARFISGGGAFMILGAVPLWMSEVVPPRIRGAMMDLHGVFLVFGYMVASWTGYGFFFWHPTNNIEWRPPLGIQMIFPFFLLCGLWWIPDSPRWLITKGRNTEALAILERLHNSVGDKDHTFARAEYYQIQKQVELEKRLDSSWLKMFTKPSYRKRLILGCTTVFFVSSSGVLVINNYGPSLYANLGYGPQQQLVFASAWLTLAFGCNILAMPLVDKFPRPRYLAFGLGMCVICLICEAAIVKNFVIADNPNPNNHALRAGVAMLFVYITFYSIGLDGTQFTYVSEIFPLHLRAKGTSAAVMMISLANIIWLQSAPTGFANVGWKFFLVFICVAGSGVFVYLFLFPDTRGLPLEEVAAIFGDADEVAVYQRELELDEKSHDIRTHQEKTAPDSVEEVSI